MDYQSEINYIQNLWNRIPRRATQILAKQNLDLFEKIEKLSGNTFSEKAWRWAFCDKGRKDPLCKSCGQAVKFLDFRRGFANYCSKKCAAGSVETSKKKRSTLLKKYGVSHFSKTEIYKKKFQETCQQRYGVNNPGQILDLIQRRARQKQLTFFTNICTLIKEKEKSEPLFTFEDYTHLRDHCLKWRCLNCKEVFLSNLLNKLPECSACYPHGNFGGPSSVEKEVLEEIQKFYNGEIITNSRSIIKPKELDIFFPEKKFAIEINGVYWHSEEKVGENYHFEKYQLCREKDINLMMITDYEWVHSKELIIRMIKHRLGLQTKKVPAKHCKVSIISSENAKNFLIKNHLHGFSKSSIHMGMYFNNELVSVCSVSNQNRFNRKSKNIEIVRLAFSDILVVGALGKFIKKIKEISPNTDIVTYADLRYGSGSVYYKNNFESTHITKPGYWYFVDGKLYHRLNWTKKKLIKMGFDSSLTEKEIMISMGAIKIFDCGHRHFILRTNYKS